MIYNCIECGQRIYKNRSRNVYKSSSLKNVCCNIEYVIFGSQFRARYEISNFVVYFVFRKNISIVYESNNGLINYLNPLLKCNGKITKDRLEKLLVFA